MSEINNIGAKINLFDREYTIAFTIRAIDTIQDFFKCHIAEIHAVLEGNSPKALLNMAYIITTLVNEQIKSEGSKDYKSLKDVIGQINPDNVGELWRGIINAYENSFQKRDEDDIGVVEKEDYFNIIRMFTVGRILGYKESDVWGMTPKYIQIMHDDYLDYHGQKKKKITVDDVIPI